MRAHVATVVASVVFAVVGGCAHGKDVEARLDETRQRVHSNVAVDDAAAIAYADAVAAALDSGVADQSDVDDALYVLRTRAAAAVERPAPLAEATARLYAAAKNDAEAERHWRDAAKAAPSAANASALLASAEKQKQQPRARALCVAGAFVVDDQLLVPWLKRCAAASAVDETTMRGWWFPRDQRRLDGNAAPVDACRDRCRVALYRAVAVCPDDDCLVRTSRGHDVCAESCSN